MKHHSCERVIASLLKSTSGSAPKDQAHLEVEALQTVTCSVQPSEQPNEQPCSFMGKFPCCTAHGMLLQ